MTVERLERYEGHLLNWYDTQTLKPLEPRYVSTVDSGNLLASLWVLEHGNPWKHRFTLAGIDHHSPEFGPRSIRPMAKKVVQDAIVRSKGRTGDVRHYFSLRRQ